MNQRLAHVALMVNDYDDAIEFFTRKLNFTLIEDTKIDENKRWVMVAPPGAKECCLLLAKAANERQTESVGNQTGGRRDGQFSSCRPVRQRISRSVTGVFRSHPAAELSFL